MRWALFCGILAALLLPVRVECDYPGAPTCSRKGDLGATCRQVQVEPWVFYTLERFAHRDLGFAYRSGEECE
jgi:hypothetical protein